jgi:maltooligosyltrehalose trehalohydrolase
MRKNERRGQVSSRLPPTAFVSFIQNHDQIGNRAFGDRIAQLGSKDANKAIAAVLLLSPNIPMLFMGQEWGSATPFCYFADLGSELAPLVTAGRRKEFAKFPEFQDPKKRDLIPDPVDPKTFTNSKLDWSDLQKPEHQEMLGYYRNLLKLRAAAIMPLLAGCSENVGRVVCQAEDSFVAVWNFSEKSSLCLVANLSDVDAHLPQSSSEIKKLSGTKPIFESSPGGLVQLNKGIVPAWSVIWAHVNDKV